MDSVQAYDGQVYKGFFEAAPRVPDVYSGRARAAKRIGATQGPGFPLFSLDREFYIEGRSRQDRAGRQTNTTVRIVGNTGRSGYKPPWSRLSAD